MFLFPPLGLAGFLSPFWESFLSSHFWGLHPQTAFHLSRGSWPYFKRSCLWNAQPQLHSRQFFSASWSTELWRRDGRVATTWHPPPSAMMRRPRNSSLTPGHSTHASEWDGRRWQETASALSRGSWQVILMSPAPSGRMSVLEENGSPERKCRWAQIIQGMQSQNLVGEQEKILPILCIKHSYGKICGQMQFCGIKISWRGFIRKSCL